MKKIFRIYMVVMGLSAVLLLIIGMTFQREVTTAVVLPETVEIKDYQTAEKENTIQMTGVLPAVIKEDMTVAFYSIHQNVTVRIQDAVVYEVKAGENLFGHTPGHCWNFITLEKKDAGEEIEIILNSPYPGVNKQPNIYMGSRLGLLKMILKRDTPGMVICGLMIIVGVILLSYSAVMWIKTKIGSELCYLGLFAMLMGIWSMNEISIVSVILNDYMLSAYLAYISLNLMLIPFILFIRSMFSNKDHILWKICCIISLVNTAATTCLQVFGILDYRQTLWGVQSTCVLFVLALTYLVIQEIRQGNFTREIKINVASLFLVMCGFLVDLVTYYVKKGDSNVIGRICFLIYIVILGCMSAQRIGNLANKGKETELYHRLAFSDALTGVYNRTAYSRHIEEYNMEGLEGMQAFMMDLNNLKWCNDNLGHTIGDNYIIHASELIQQIFGKKAKIYRIGGDEFCVLLRGMSAKEVDSVLSAFERKKIFVKLHEVHFMGRVACGYAEYEMGDLDMYAIIRRADAKMYENKKKIKEMDRRRA